MSYFVDGETVNKILNDLMGDLIQDKCPKKFLKHVAIAKAKFIGESKNEKSSK